MNADWPRKFNPANPPTKNPAAMRRAGRERTAGRAGYFFAGKMYLATCALWFEAEFRWMTSLLTARSSAEL